MRLVDVVDLIRRRTYTILPADGFRAIYVQVGVSPKQVTFILDRDLPAPELASLKLKYKRVFGDKETDVAVNVLNNSDYYVKLFNCVAIYDPKNGFTCKEVFK